MPLHVAFYWHMHQPDYVDPENRTALLPWVRLHAAKGYYDMVRLAEEFPTVPMTFNLTPVLVSQMLKLQHGEVRDAWQELTRTPVERLTPEMQLSLLENFFSAPVETMIRPYSRYYDLLELRGHDNRPEALKQALRRFSPADWRDLQVWFNLAWCGYFAVRDLPPLAALRRKGRNFSEADKQTVLDAHLELVKRSLAKYRELNLAGRIELTTSPFYHPILPLIYNTDYARRCMPHAPMPRTFSFAEDIKEHLDRAVRLHEEVFGKRPTGLWPSEGSVCPELAPYVKNAGFEWMATDEAILFRSLQMMRGDHATPRREELFGAYRLNYGGASVGMCFRDRPLSDYFGFTASRQPARVAARHVIDTLGEIARHNSGPHAFALVLLDGENAWQEFTDGGEEFLRHIYGALATDTRFKPVTVTDYFRNHPPEAELTTLHTGSWIYADFDIWIGDPEENRAWDLLGDARRTFAEMRDSLTPAARESAFLSLMAAEGSDWFWWYGPEFQIEHKPMFDDLFRRHLRCAYRAMGQPVPPDVLKPIVSSTRAELYEQPREFISPVIDGRRTSYYEWLGSGTYRAAQGHHAMAKADALLRELRFGFDAERFYLCLEWNERKGGGADAVTIEFADPKAGSLRLGCLTAGNGSVAVEMVGEWSKLPAGEQKQLLVGRDRIIELALPRRWLSEGARKSIGFRLKIEASGQVFETHPNEGYFEITAPLESSEADWWLV